MKLLIKYGADINCQDIDGYTPLHYATEYGYGNLVIYFLEKEVNTSIKNKKGKTAL